jgi:hypothetical protein
MAANQKEEKGYAKWSDQAGTPQWVLDHYAKKLRISKKWLYDPTIYLTNW